MDGTAEAISRVCGWLYLLAWSLSFYPQAILNFRRQTTQGLEPDYPLLNVVGFTCYTVSTSAFLFSTTIREQYAQRHPLSPKPTVRFNDFVFGAHALIMCLVTYSQFFPRLWRWKKRPGVKRQANLITRGLIWGALLALAIVVCIILTSSKGSDSSGPQWDWIDAVYAISYVKLLLVSLKVATGLIADAAFLTRPQTIAKYIPQAIANFRRKSTVGWSITQQLLDFSGGILSLLQLVIDSSLQGDWSGISGNPMKTGLSGISLLFDLLFIVQHYVLYGPVPESKEYRKSVTIDPAQEPRSERQPLISSDV